MSRILLVDDNSDWITLTIRQLTAKGYDVLSAGNGFEALKVLDSNHVDLMITDIVMPDMDGFELFMALNKRQQRPRVIVMSGGAMGIDGANLLHMAKLMGAEKNMLKPISYAVLEAAIAEVLADRSEPVHDRQPIFNE